jgi:hypothetical protein
MEDDKKLQEALDRLTDNSEKWLKIKHLLQQEIRSNVDLISFIDKIIIEKEKNISVKN